MSDREQKILSPATYLTKVPRQILKRTFLLSLNKDAFSNLPRHLAKSLVFEYVHLYVIVYFFITKTLFITLVVNK